MSMIRREKHWVYHFAAGDGRDIVILGNKEEDGDMYLMVEEDGKISALRMTAVDRVIVTDNAQEF